MIPPQSMRRILIEPTFAAWREQARLLLANHIAPEEVTFIDHKAEISTWLFAPDEAAPLQHAHQAIFVPKDFLERAPIVACNRGTVRWNLLYRVLWRLQRDRSLLAHATDDDVALFERMEDRVLQDRHKMHAFVRFRKVTGAEGERYIAWHQPDHHILRLASPFFIERFAVMRWSILTPDECAHWNPATRQLLYTPGVTRDHAPQNDELEALWKTYFASIFNPARLNTRAMRSDMPSRYWKNMPELDTLPELLKKAPGRVQAMIDQSSQQKTPRRARAAKTPPK